MPKISALPSRAAASIKDADYIPVVDSATGGVTYRAPVSELQAKTNSPLSGSGSPEAVTAAAVGRLYVQTDGVNGKTLWRKRSGSGNTGWALMQGDLGWYDAKEYGALGNGTTDDRAILNTIANTSIPATGGTLYLPSGNYLVGSALTFPSNVSVQFAVGARLVSSAAVTITFNGPVTAERTRIFDSAPTGGAIQITAVFGKNVLEAYPEWWGAVGDGVTDDYAALNLALNSSAGIVQLGRATYLIGTGLLVPNGYVLRGISPLLTYIRYSGVAGPAVRLGVDSNAMNYSTRLEQCSVLLSQKTSVGVKLHGTNGAVVRDVIVEGSTSQGYAARTNIGVEIDASDISSFYNHLENILCNHCHIAFKIHSSGASYTTQSTFLNCSGFGDKVFGDTTSIGYLFLRSPVTTTYIGNGDGSVIIGGNMEEYATALKIEGGPIYSEGLRIEACTTAVHFTSTSGRNYIGASGLTDYGTILDESLTGALNTVRVSDEGGWRGYARFSGSGAFPQSGQSVHAFESQYNNPGIENNKTHTGFTNDAYRCSVSSAGSAAWAFINLYNSTVQALAILGNGNVQNLNNSYGALSDRKLKQGVRAAGSQLEDVKRLAGAMSKFKLKSDPEKREQLGWVAQDVAEISPGLVYATADKDRETDEPLGTETFGVQYSVAYLKGFKALGELIEIVEEQGRQLEQMKSALAAKG